MANDFSSDTNCVALWSFENEALKTDSKGSNTLTNGGYGNPSADTVNYKEGSASADFESSSNECLYIQDGNLDAGFPIKNGGTGVISVCFWIKLESITGQHSIFDKTYTGGGHSFLIDVLSGTPAFRMHIGYDGGSSLEVLTHASEISTGIWYHVGMTFDNADKSYRIRVWDDNAGSILGSDLTGTATNNMNISAQILHIGAYQQTNNFLDGLLDELVVFKDILSADEIDGIRGGAFGSGTVLGLAGTVAGVSSVAGAIGANPVSVLGLAGTSNGVSVVEGAIGANPVSVLGLAGTSDGVSAVTGAIGANPVLVSGLAGTSAGVSSVTGAIGANPVSVLSLAGLSAGVSSVTGALTKTLSNLWRPPSPTYYAEGYGYYQLLIVDGAWGDPPPTGTPDVDYVIVSLLPNQILSFKRLVCAANAKIWFEDI